MRKPVTIIQNVPDNKPFIDLTKTIKVDAEVHKVYIEWKELLVKLFAGEVILGLEAIKAYQFQDLLDEHIDKYTVFINGQYAYYALKTQNQKIYFKNILQSEKIAFNIYYYAIWDKSYSDTIKPFRNMLSRTTGITGFYDEVDLQYEPDDVEFYNEVALMVCPHIYVDMLSLIYKVDAANRDINAIVLIANDAYLIPAIKELQENDIAVYLAVSPTIRTNIKLLRTCNGIILLDDYLQHCKALTGA